jgi:hypothetical protein
MVRRSHAARTIGVPERVPFDAAVLTGSLQARQIEKAARQPRNQAGALSDRR